MHAIGTERARSLMSLRLTLRHHLTSLRLRNHPLHLVTRRLRRCQSKTLQALPESTMYNTVTSARGTEYATVYFLMLHYILYHHANYLKATSLSERASQSFFPRLSCESNSPVSRYILQLTSSGKR